MSLKSETIITIIALFIIAILTITAALLFAYPYNDINGLVPPDNRTPLILTGVAAGIALLAIVIYLIFIGITRHRGWRSWHDFVTFVSLIVIAILCIIVLVNPDNITLAKILLWISFGLSLLALLIVIIVDITIVRDPIPVTTTITYTTVPGAVDVNKKTTIPTQRVSGCDGCSVPVNNLNWGQQGQVVAPYQPSVGQTVTQVQPAVVQPFNQFPNTGQIFTAENGIGGFGQF